MEAFENGAKKASYTVVFVSVFGRFRVDDRRKHIQKDAFFYENGLVWRSENKMKTQVRSNIFCFVIVETKTDTYKNVLVRSGPSVPVISNKKCTLQELELIVISSMKFRVNQQTLSL